MLTLPARLSVLRDVQKSCFAQPGSIAGEILSDSCTKGILRIARAALLLATRTVLVQTLQVVILSSSSPPGQSNSQIGIDSIVLARRKMRSKEPAEKIGITKQNLSLLKTGKVKGIRFEALAAICAALECWPGDLPETVCPE